MWKCSRLYTLKCLQCCTLKPYYRRFSIYTRNKPPLQNLYTGLSMLPPHVLWCSVKSQTLFAFFGYISSFEMLINRYWQLCRFYLQLLSLLVVRQTPKCFLQECIVYYQRTYITPLVVLPMEYLVQSKYWNKCAHVYSRSSFSTTRNVKRMQSTGKGHLEVNITWEAEWNTRFLKP